LTAWKGILNCLLVSALKALVRAPIRSQRWIIRLAQDETPHKTEVKTSSFRGVLFGINRLISKLYQPTAFGVYLQDRDAKVPIQDPQLLGTVRQQKILGVHLWDFPKRKIALHMARKGLPESSIRVYSG
jgi:hypothetical protein